METAVEVDIQLRSVVTFTTCLQEAGGQGHRRQTLMFNILINRLCVMLPAAADGLFEMISTSTLKV